MVILLRDGVGGMYNNNTDWLLASKCSKEGRHD